MVPHKSWGTMDNDVNAKHTWTDEECDEVVGGLTKKNCDGIYTLFKYNIFIIY